MVELENILDSRIKKVRIELPHYSFSHSSSGESSHTSFVGRKKIQEKLAKLIEATTDETGVYLVTGNRGVGKTRLVNQVINQTSLEHNSDFFENIKYLLGLLFPVVVTQFCLQKFIEPTSFWKVCVCAIVCALGSLILCWFSCYRHKIHKQNISFWEKLKEIFISAFKKELFISINPYNQYRLAQYILKMILVVSLTQLFSIIPYITPTIVFIGYSVIVLCCMFRKFVIYKGREYYHKYQEENLSKCKITFQVIIFEILLNPIRDYIKNHRRLYLRINFGHKLKDEKDILRLIARTLNTEYHEYLRLLKRILPWRVMAFSFLFLFAYLFSTIVEKQEFYIPIKESDLYQASSQVHLNDFIYSKDSTYLRRKDFVYYIKKDSIYAKKDPEGLEIDVSSWIKKNNFIYFEIKDSIHIEKKSRYLKIEDFFGIKKNKECLEHAFTNDNCSFNKAETFLLVLDQFVFEISKRVKKIPQILLCKDKIDFDKEFIPPANYLFWLSFFTIYLLCILIFRCDFVTHFFVTNRIIKRQLKKLNSDITYSTELENSVNIKSESIGIGTKTKKSRSIADAREIEKELQDILKNVQRIPFFMCRPNVVIVFDELDKVEPSESKSENENQKTKASLFSIDASRERQTEILKILSNMKYFLSTVNAKFIFIAGREMYDIYLADVSERNNYIGSIFNAVIYVPSFLTDPSDGNRDITSLIEEFVCQKLIPYDYWAEYCNLKNYRIYLEEKIYNDAKIREIEQNIQQIISNQNEETKKKIVTPIEVKQIQNIIDEQNKEIKKKIVTLQIKEIEQKIQRIISKESEKVNEKINAIENIEVELIQKIIDELNKEIERKIIYELNKETEQKIQKIIAVLQQFIIYLAHVSKGAPKKMMQFFESFIEVREIDKNEEDKCLVVQNYHNSKLFLTFNYYKQYTIGIIAYLITPIFYRLSKSNIKEHSDKLLVSSLRFIDFLFKFHKHPFSWKHLDISPEMLEVNRSPALKSVTMDLLNYLAQVHINKSNFSLSDYKFDNLIANEISAMTKMDNVFSALFSFSLDEMLPLKKHYQDLLEETQKEYQNDINSPKFYLKNKSSPKFIDAISSLQVVLGDLHYYDDELEEAGVYYKNAVQVLSNLKLKNEDHEGKENETMTLEQHYIYVRNMLRLGMIYEKRRQYDFAYLTYGEICKRIISNTSISLTRPLYFESILSNTNDMLSMTYEGLKMLYLPFIAKLQILEKSHMGGITINHLEQLEKEFTSLTNIIDHKEAKLLEAEFYSRLADILYYKNSDLKSKKKKNRKEDDDKNKSNSSNDLKDTKNYSCTACYYYHKALSILLGLDDLDKNENTVTKLLSASVKQIKDNYNMKYCTILARILSDWGNVFFSCDDKHTKCENDEKDGYKCYICDAKDCNTRRTCSQCSYYICNINDCNIQYTNNLRTFLKKYIDYVDSEEDNGRDLLDAFKKDKLSKIEIAFAMYAISSKAYIKSNLYKRSACQIFKMLRLFKYYEFYDDTYIKILSQKAIRYLLHANEDLNMFEIKKRKKDFDKYTKNIPLQSILVDSEIHRVLIWVKELELKKDKTSQELKEYYCQYITSPYEINYSIMTRIYQLRLKAIINHKAYEKIMLDKETIKEIFSVDKNILERLIAETIFCFKEIIRLSKTIGETYLLNHVFMGSIHKHLAFWIREKYKNKLSSKINKYLEHYFGKEWEEQLSSYYEKQQALSHYYKSLEMHNEGRAYHNMIDNMCYLKDDYNDRSDHFSIAEERHYILNDGIKEKIEELKELYKDSELYKVDNYYEHD